MNQGLTIVPPPVVGEALRRLEARGFRAWCVGGCVRDSLLGKAPSDWDIATSALPQETKACFAGERLVEAGAAHGTIAWVPSGGNPIEITTFRSDGAYTDGRHPDSVAFSRRLEDDLSRRDFTVNAMAWHPQRGLVDLFHGQEDLSAGLLRCVGEPARRFSEDALRILRCLRFSSQLGFAIHPDTARALWEKRELLLALSHERVREELTKLLCGQGAAAVLRQYAAVVFTVLPELAPMKGCAQETPYHCFDVWEHTLHAVDYAPQQGDLRWAALLHDAGKPGRKTRSADGVAHFYGHPPESGRIARQLLTRLRFSNKERDWIAALVDHHEDAMPMGEAHLKGLLGRYGERFVFTLFQLQEADMSAKAPGVFARRLPDLEESRALARAILERGDCLTLGDMALTGEDLKALGVAPGPEMGKLLRRLLEAVQRGEAANTPAALGELAKRLLKRGLYTETPRGIPHGAARPTLGRPHAKADGQGLVHPAHGFRVQAAHFFPQPVFVQGAHLLQQNDGIFDEPRALGVYGDVGGQVGLVLLAGDGGGNHRGAELVAHIVLHNEHRPHAALLRAHHGAQVRVVNLSSVYNHGFHAPCKLVVFSFAWLGPV